MRVFVVYEGKVHAATTDELEAERVRVAITAIPATSAASAAPADGATGGARVAELLLRDAPPILTLATSRRLSKAFELITLAEFTRVLKETIRTTRDYAEACYSGFRMNPVAYCASRNPITQGEALFRLALTKLDQVGRDDDSPRPLDGPGPGTDPKRGRGGRA
jgi:hypothetical protein